MNLSQVDPFIVLYIIIVVGYSAICCHLEMSRNYWRRRARFFEDRTYENLRLNFRDHTQNPDPADWWKEQP